MLPFFNDNNFNFCKGAAIINKVIFILFVVLFIGCQDNFDDTFHPTVSGRIVNYNNSGELNVIDVSTKNSISYGRPYTSTRPVWSFDGTKFATFEKVDNSQPDSPYYSVKIVDAEQNTVTNWRIGEDYKAAKGDLTWSPDGNTIAFLQGRNIVYLNTLNGDTTITNFSLADSLNIYAIAWHPSKEKIALCVTYIHINPSGGFIDSTNNSIFLMNPYANNLENLIPIGNYGKQWDNYIPSHLDWNFDGSMLLLSRYEDKILIMNVEEGEIKPIPDIWGNSACWSTDGEYILFQKKHWSSMNSATDNFYITTIEGSSKYLLMKGSGLVDWY